MGKEAEIVSAASVPRTGGGWHQRGSATPFKLTGAVRQTIPAAAQNGCADHAEMRALSTVTASEMNNVRLDQNAFPCERCHAALLSLSSQHTITVQVTANKGSYNLCHKISGLTVEEVPCSIVYQAGHASYNGTRDDFRLPG